MFNTYKYFLVLLLLLSSSFAFAQLKPAQIDSPADQSHLNITEIPNAEFYSAAFKIRANGKLIATPQTTARAGQEVIISSTTKTPYKISFILLDHTMFDSKSVFGAYAPDNTASQILVEAELSLKNSSLTDGTWETISTPMLLATIDGKAVSSKIDTSRTYMKSPVSEDILQNITVEVEIISTQLNAIDLAKAKQKSNANNCQPDKSQKPDILKFGGTSPTAPGDGDGDDNCCTDGCLQCCGASACCQDPWNCPGGGCCT